MREIVIDSNLLLLLIVGSGDRGDIYAHKRLRPTYAEEHFELLLSLISGFQQIVVTPHSLTEANNLMRYAEGNRLVRSSWAFEQIAKTAFEVFDDSSQIVDEPEFQRLGLADVAQMMAAAKGRTLLTSDAGLYLAAARRKVNVINFWHKWEAQQR